MKKVQILLSTYNGERFLIEQLNSIKNQSHSNISLLIRDDGSTDNTVEIIKKYIELNTDFNIRLIEGDNLGVIGSFMELVNLSDDTCDYYGFSDQDDVWFKNKVEKGINSLEKKSECLIYSSAFIPVDKDLKEVSYKKPNFKPSFYNSLIENIATGCTIIFSKEMKELVEGRDYSKAAIHDWWFYIVSTSLGEICYDETPLMYYRQHDGNTIGAKNGRFSKWVSRFKRISSWRKEILAQCKLLLREYDSVLIEDKKNCVIEFLEYRELSFFKRIKYIRSKKIYRQNKMDNYIFNILLLFKLIK